jgi:hypothetical protein
MVWRLGVTAGAESWHWSVGPRRGAARQQRCVHPCTLRGGGGGSAASSFACIRARCVSAVAGEGELVLRNVREEEHDPDADPARPRCPTRCTTSRRRGARRAGPASTARGATGGRASFSVERAVIVLGGVGAQSSNGEGLVEVAASARRRGGSSLERSATREGPVAPPREPEAKPSLPRPPKGLLTRSLRLLPQSPLRSRQRRRRLSERGAPLAVNGNSTAGVACCRRR